MARNYRHIQQYEEEIMELRAQVIVLNMDLWTAIVFLVGRSINNFISSLIHFE